MTKPSLLLQESTVLTFPRNNFQNPRNSNLFLFLNENLLECMIRFRIDGVGKCSKCNYKVFHGITFNKKVKELK